LVNIQDAKTAGDNHIFRCDFSSRRSVQDLGGIITTCAVNKGLSPTATTSKVSFIRTESLSINMAVLTVAIRFKLHTTGALDYNIIQKSSASDAQWLIKLTGGNRLDFHICPTAANFGNYAYMSASTLTLGTEYVAHCVYNSSLVEASRGIIYINGVAATTAIQGTITSMRAGTQPISIFSATIVAPPTDFILRSANVYSTAFSADDVLADYKNSLSSGITP